MAPRSIAPVIRRVEVDQHPGAVLQLMVRLGIISGSFDELNVFKEMGRDS